MAKEKLTENQDFMEVMEHAADEDYTAAAKKIAEMEQDAEESREKSGVEQEYEAALAEQDGVVLNYDLTGEEVEAAIGTFQKKTLYKKNIIYTVLLAIIVVAYGIDLVRNPNNMFGYIVAFGCAIIIFMLWNLPYRHKKSSALAADAVDDRFDAAIFDGVLYAGTGAQMAKIIFTEKTFVVEHKLGMIIGANKEQVFMLPNRCMDEAEQEKLRDLLKKSVGERYKETK